ncbi:MAG: ubiquinone/menaquinone biosynthesis methyltransferase [Anaerolineaceae bacterium]|nr:ubiquinone/menaquinone biosynthesis methyltransferase [Anaerolineaceae bacterium]
MSQVELDKSPAAIRGMFTRIARRYDLLNRLISLGFDQTLRRKMISRLNGKSIKRIVDIGCGTGDVSILLAQAYPHSLILACDMTLEMIRVGKERTQHSAIHWMVCDSTQMPFEPASMDGCVSAFLLRNVLDLAAVIQEQARITKAQGMFLTLETTPPRSSFLYPFVWLYFHSVIPLLGWLVAGNPRAYQYLPSSSLQFLPAEQLSQTIAENGWQQAQVERKMMGVMAIHQAQR